MSKMTMFMVLLMVATTFAFPTEPSYFGCTSSEDCNIDECCVMGMTRYSIPICKPLSSENDMCRPRGDFDMPQNVTVTYPDGSSANVYVNMIVCPCDAGLECSNEMVCTGLDGAGKIVLREDYTDVDEINHL